VLSRPTDLEAAAESVRSSGYDVRSTDGEFTVADPWGIVMRMVAP
jgi:hypothetical protein